MVYFVDRRKAEMLKDTEKKRLELILEDENAVQLRVTLWDNYMDQFLEFVNNTGCEAEFLILQFCRGRPYLDTVTVCTSLNATNMLINPQNDEATSYKARFMQNLDESKCLSAYSRVSYGYPIEESRTDVVRNIHQLKTGGEVGTFWVWGNIVSIETDGRWWYVSCPRCYKSAANVKNRFYCSSCDRFDPTGTLRYNVQVLVQDDNNNAVFQLWDPHCLELIGKTVADLKKDLGKELDDDALPQAITSLEGKECLFKVQVKPDQVAEYFGAYSVKKVSTDEVFISKVLSVVPVSNEVEAGDEATTPLKSNASTGKGKQRMNSSGVEKIDGLFLH